MSYLINQITQELLNEKVTASKFGTGPGYYVPASASAWLSQSNFWNKIGLSDFTINAEFTAHSGAFIIASQVSGTDLTFNNASFKIGSGASVSLPGYSFKSGEKYSVSVSADRDGLSAYYVNGKLFGGVDISSASGISLSGTFYAFRGATGISQTVHGLRVFNRALTASEVEQVSRGQYLGFADYGASGVAQTSGTLTIGKRYIISNFIAGDDFTNVGAAANATGEVFIATGTTPTAWANLSGITQLGLVLDLNEWGMAPGKWHDQSGNDYHGTVTGATLINANEYLYTTWIVDKNGSIGGDGQVLSKSSTGLEWINVTAL